MNDLIGARGRRQRWLATALLCSALGSAAALAQTTFGSATSIAFPVIAATTIFTGQVTLYNPNGSAITVTLDYFDANDVPPPSIPGPKPCADVPIPANSSVQFVLADKCTLGSGDRHFGLLIASDSAGTNSFYGYSRTQADVGPNAGAGFSIEGFPIGNFTTQTSYSTGLAGSPTGGPSTYQSNCFVGSMADAVTYDLKLFDGTSGVQIGSTISGSLNAFEQIRYLNIFDPAPGGVNAPVANYSNVRAEFTRTSAGTQVLIGFCTVQDTTLNADFRIAKSFGGSPQNAFVQGGNAFGTTALLGTTDNQPLHINVNGARVMRYEPNATSPNVIGGHPNNGVYVGVFGASIAGGGASGAQHAMLLGDSCELGYGCLNGVTDAFGTIGGGAGNQAGDGVGTTSDTPFATVAGGVSNWALGGFSSVGGGRHNAASGFSATVGGGAVNTASGNGATVPGGVNNTAAGDWSFAAGHSATIPASASGTFLWADTNGATLPAGAHDEFIAVATNGIGFYTYSDFSHGCALVGAAASWACTSDRATKSDFMAIEPRDVLARLVHMPISQWRWKGEAESVHHVGPTAQDFRAAFGLGYDDKTITLVDTEGVALAAIQGLYAELKERDAIIAAQQREIEEDQHQIAELRNRVAQVESLRGELAALRNAIAAAMGAATITGIAAVR